MFDEKRAQLRKEYKHLSPDRLAEIFELRTSYGDSMFVPPRARWGVAWAETLEDGKAQLHPALKDTQTGIGEMLNKAIAALEDEGGQRLPSYFNINRDIPMLRLATWFAESGVRVLV